MIKIQGKIPRKVMVACSGGIDSMAVLDFLRRNHSVEVFHFNHNTPGSDIAEQCVRRYCYTHKIPVVVRALAEPTGYLDEKMSKEDYWRRARYRWIDLISRPDISVEGTSGTMITCHHLDDCVETWVWSSMHGTGKIIPYRRNNVIRPFRQTRKRDFELWAAMHNVPYVEDDSNADVCYTRNYIRHEMMPHVLRVNPGIHKTIAKKVKDERV
jgi:tRNA(Ile)-lysidine synthase